MKIIKVTFASGNSLITRINGTEHEIKNYYKTGKYFNVGTVNDEFDYVKYIEFLNQR